MNKKVQFEVSITNEDRISFAKLSGDFNPLHINEEYAATTEYGKCILHGAFSSGLFSRMAGMYIPGEKCVLVDMKIKFVAPTITPCELIVIGESVLEDKLIGEVKITIFNKNSGILLTTGSYKYLLHNSKINNEKQPKLLNNSELDQKFLVTGASGALGSRVLKILGNKAIGISLSNGKQFFKLNSYSELSPLYKLNDIQGIIHCAGPSPDNNQLTETYNLESDIHQNISRPLQDIISLSKLIKKKGIKNSALIIVGSSFAYPGRHSWKMPMYSLSKSLIPNLTKILALEMSRANKKIIGLTFEMIDGGMNKNLSPIINQMNSDRMLNGNLTSMDEAANQIKWILENPSDLISGSLIDCTGGAIP